MISVGIEDMNVYGGLASLDVIEIAKLRQLDNKRFENLLMKQKTVAMQYEDPVSYGVNAAKPIVDTLSEEEKKRIELVITCTESGIDFGKSISTYLHDYLGLSRNCRMFELKNACYSGVAGFQMAVSFVLSQASPGAKALVVCSDISRLIAVEKGQKLDWDMAYTEPSSGAGAVAILVSDKPSIFKLDVGANGYYGYEVMDTCRPAPDCDAGDVDLSLLSYMDCCEQAFAEYCKRVENVDFVKTFQYMAYHTPFVGMVKGTHRTMLRKTCKITGKQVEKDFNKRVMPSMEYCQNVGNIMGATAMLSLLSAIDNGEFNEPKRIGCFSYGSGCCSEFFSGVANQEGQKKLRKKNINAHLAERYPLSIDEYESILQENSKVHFGVRNLQSDLEFIPAILEIAKKNHYLVLDKINEYHREYKWM